MVISLLSYVIFLTINSCLLYFDGIKEEKVMIQWNVENSRRNV